MSQFDVPIRLVESIDDLLEFQRWLGQRRQVLALDIESGGLNPYAPAPEGDVRLVQFGDVTGGWGLEWENWRGPIIELLYGYQGEVVGHNIGFDIKWLTVKSGKDWPHWGRTHDTMTQVHLDDTSQPKGLKPTCARFFGNQAVAGQDALHQAMKQNKWTWATVPTNHPLYWGYGILDTILTAMLHDRLYSSVSSLYGDVYEMEMDVLRICTNMSLRGVRIDREYIHEKIKKLRQYADSVRAWCRTEYGIENTNSTAQLIDRFKADGINFHKLTEKGRIAMDKEVLEALAPIHPLAGQITKVKHAEKMIETYLENFLAMTDSDDYLHCNINPIAAKTGRMSITEPALQTLPRDDQLVRGAIIASEGNALVKCDADQIEARMMASLSKDPAFIQAFREEGDFFCKIASRIFQEDIAKSDPRRQTTKNTVYSLQYGAGVPTMARTAGITYEEMLPISESMKQEFEGVYRFMEQVEQVAKTRKPPHVYSQMGRRLVGYRDSEYKLVNYLIQCGAAEVMKRNLVELDNHGFGEYLAIPVHDEIIIDVPEHESHERAGQMEEIMYDDQTFEVPITWGAEVLGQSWGKRG